MAALINWLLNLAKSIRACCLNLLRRRRDDDDDAGADIVDINVWDRELEDFSFGQFSFAMVQANRQIEDEAQVESGPDGLFVGVYDGHGGTRTSAFCYENLFPHLTRLAEENGTISENILKSAVTATEDGFIQVVRDELKEDPDIAGVGSCCLVALVWKGTLYVANLGDSRAVIGRINTSTNKMVADTLTKDDNVNSLEVRQALWEAHPDDPYIVQKIHGIWRIKGQILVSKAIGDAYLKYPEHSLVPKNARLRLPEAIRRPVLSAEPTMLTRPLQSSDKFLICASDGLWDHISDQRAVDIVNRNPPEGIARRLAKAAIKVAARKSGYTYDHIKVSKKETRRSIHDDITVVVVFFNHEVGYDASVHGRSIRGFKDPILPARFNLQGVA